MAESKNRVPASGKIDAAAKKLGKTGASKAFSKKIDKLAAQKNGKLKIARLIMKQMNQSGRAMRSMFVGRGESLFKATYKKDGKKAFGVSNSQKALKQAFAGASLEQRASAGRLLNTKFGTGKNAMTVADAFTTIHGKRGSARITAVRAGIASKTPPPKKSTKGGKTGRSGRKPAAGNRGKPKTKK